MSNDPDNEFSSEGEGANFDITSDHDKVNVNQLHNVPKVSSSNLMIKSKASMNFKNMQSL